MMFTRCKTLFKCIEHYNLLNHHCFNGPEWANLREIVRTERLTWVTVNNGVTKSRTQLNNEQQGSLAPRGVGTF